MKKFFSDIRIIGVSLSILYAGSLMIFLGYVQIPEYKARVIIYMILLGCLFIASLAIAMLQEWGRKLILMLNAIMLLGFLAKYIQVVDLAPIAYALMNLIVFMYFSQPKVKFRFETKDSVAHKTILIVDDDEIHLKTIKSLLMSYGYIVLSANSGEQGLEIAKTQRPDLILLDVILPGIKGRDVCKKLKSDQATQRIPVIFITSKDSPDDIQAEMDVGALKHLTKPVNPKVLLSTIQEIFE